MTNARAMALQVLLAWHKTGTYPDQLLRELLVKNPQVKPSDRALMYQLVYGVLRWQGKLDWILKQFSQKPLEKLSLKTLYILRLGVFQIISLSRIPASAAVNESVELAKSSRAPWTAGFVNAILRYANRGKEDIFYPLQDDPVSYLAVNFSHPTWLVKKWIETWGFEKTKSLCQANNRVPAISIRVNRLKISRQQLMERLQTAAFQVKELPFSPEGIRVEDPDFPLVQSQWYRQGLFQIQDEASQMIARILDPKPGENILDLCAGAGGKATHLAQLMNNKGRILAVDLHQGKIKDLMENVERMGIDVIQGMTGDGLKENLFQKNPVLFDRILIDAPCSGWGVIGRNPDLKWRLGPEDSHRLALMQNKFLQNAVKWLRSNGVLVYCTCTLSREENQDVIQRLLNDYSELIMEDVSPFLPESARRLVDGQGFFQTWPPTHGMDGFFAARLKKK